MSLKIDRLLRRAKKLSKRGELNKSKEVYLTVLKISPDNQTAINELSSLNKSKRTNLAKNKLDNVMKLYSSGSLHKSLTEVNLLINEFPNEPVLHNISGACYSEIGPADSAIKEFKKAILLKPDYAEAYFNLGVVFQKIDKDNDAIESYKKAIEIKHAYPHAHNNIGLIQLKSKKLDSAITSFEWAVAFDPNYFEAHNNLGAAFQELNSYKKAKIHYEKSISINPNFAQALNNLGATCEILGLKNDALEYYVGAIEKDPGFTVAHRNLSAIKKYHENDPHIGQLESLYSKTELSIHDKKNICFALAKVNEDLGNKNKFFHFLNEANQIRKRELNYSFSSTHNLYSNILKSFEVPPKLKKKPLKDGLKKRPIFIVGMPRSGTTLVEQIISSHYQVHGAGELNNIKNIVTPILTSHLNSNRKNINQKNIESMRQKYLDSLLALKTNEMVITDKMPINFWFIGFILSAIPEAKIIHVKRDARATCWSNYKHNFTSGNGFTFDQEDLTKCYKLYTEIMDFWHKLFPNKIFDLNYEKLTENQKTETEKLLKYCELEWDSKCLEFYNNDRGIKTASASQVRQKMYQGSSDAWKQYESYIQPIVRGLEGY